MLWRCQNEKWCVKMFMSRLFTHHLYWIKLILAKPAWILRSTVSQKYTIRAALFGFSLASSFLSWAIKSLHLRKIPHPQLYNRVTTISTAAGQNVASPLTEFGWVRNEPGCRTLVCGWSGDGRCFCVHSASTWLAQRRGVALVAVSQYWPGLGTGCRTWLCPRAFTQSPGTSSNSADVGIATCEA